jgi:hypothetical protein
MRPCLPLPLAAARLSTPLDHRPGLDHRLAGNEPVTSENG